MSLGEGLPASTPTDLGQPQVLSDEVLREMSAVDIVDCLGAQIETARQAWDDLTTAKRTALDKETIDSLALYSAEEDTEIIPVNRSERRFFYKVYRTYTGDYIRDAVTRGQGVITWIRYGTPEQQATARASLQENQDHYQQITNHTSEDSELEQHATVAYHTVAEAFTQALDADRDLLEPLARWMSTSVGRLPELVQWIASDDCDRAGRHMPLLQALARIHSDPHMPSFPHDRLSAIREKPELLQRVFMSQLSEHASTGSADQTEQGFSDDINVSWMRFLPVVFEHLGIQISQETLAEVMSRIPLNSLPLNLSSQIVSEHLARTDEVRQAYEAQITPFIRRDRHLVMEEPGMPPSLQPTTAKNPKGKKSRVQRRPVSGTVEATTSLEPERRVSKVVMLAETPRGTTAVEIKQASSNQSLVDQLMGTRAVTSYISKYTSPDTAETVRMLLQSALDQPRGNGAVKMNAGAVRFINPDRPSTHIRLPIWELSPRKRTLEQPVSQFGNKTRLFYVLIPGGEGAETFGLLRIAHKNIAQKLGVNATQ